MAAQLPDIAAPQFIDATGIAAGPDRVRTKLNYELWIPAVLLGLLAAACFLWPLIDRSFPSPIIGDVTQQNLPPLSPGHLFGTDPLGDDVFSRILYGGRVSLEVGISVQVIGILIGGTFGMLAGYRGGKTELLIMRAFDMLLAFPSLVLALVVAAYLGPSELHVIWAISFFSIPAFARLSRTTTLRVREQKFIAAARHSGTSDVRIVTRHVAPNVLPLLLTFSLLGVALVILFEATLDFLGVGIPPPAPSWGNMIALGQPYLSTDPWLVFIPALFLFFTVVCLNLLGDALRAKLAAE